MFLPALGLGLIWARMCVCDWIELRCVSVSVQYTISCNKYRILYVNVQFTFITTTVYALHVMVVYALHVMVETSGDHKNLLR